MWDVEFDESFKTEFSVFDRDVKIEMRAAVNLLRMHGPSLGRPRVDTLHGSRHVNMKELRFEADDGAWRVAFDPRRRAIILVAGDKSGVSQKVFYKRLIGVADKRFDAHLKKLKEHK